MSKSEYKLIVESKKQDVIQTAFDMAETYFENISPITSSAHTGSQSFVIVSNSSGTAEDILYDSQEQQAFLDWCAIENVKAEKEILNVKLLKLY